MRDAILIGAVFVNADLSHADLTDAEVEGADFEGANLRGAKMMCKKIHTADLNGAIYDANTTWPDGFNPASRGAKLKQL